MSKAHGRSLTSHAAGDHKGAASCEAHVARQLGAPSTMFHEEVCTANNKLDLPLWDLLDDKVQLNGLLDADRLGKTWAPRGFAMPHQLPQLVAAAAAEPSSWWMVKEGKAHGGRGNRLLQSVDAAELSAKRECVVQRYVADPYLLDRLKFTLRIYVVVLSVSPLTAFICRQGLMLFAVEEYEGPHESGEMGGARSRAASRPHQHITNQTYNSNHPEYELPPDGHLKRPGDRASSSGDTQEDRGVAEGGHTRSLDALRDHLTAACEGPGAGKSSRVAYQQVWASIKWVCAAPIRAMMKDEHWWKWGRTEHWAAHARMRIPKVLGIDVLLDSSLRPWVLEVNRTPALGCRLELDGAVKRTLMRDAWSLAVALKKEGDVPESSLLQADFGCLEPLIGHHNLADKTDRRKGCCELTRAIQDGLGSKAGLVITTMYLCGLSSNPPSPT
ncbi:hypothetical protein CYMTET_42385 [Cymbomonas tetramitiformis]|uniref:Tubulin--tyrosine ligase-like protein 5 n=1 Tax=Cymbomonas tetramitiformis TaxID=36881 RepID=A0AAE0C6D1_9CHLO|nr:hypothetical protein CYMTET_42385 [Cymbomonas tetramitiformis]